MDSPGLYDTTKTQEEVSITIVQAVACTHPGPHAILYVIQIGRYTAEEFGVFNRLKALFDDSVVKYMIVLFTRGDDLEKEGKTLADLLKHAPKELTQVVEECNHRCIVFNNNAKNTKPQVEKLLEQVKRMNKENGSVPYNCPKYNSIGEGLEEEVNKRLEAVEKRDLEREKYVQELEAKTQAAEKAVAETREEFGKKEQERKLLVKKEREKSKRETEQLRNELKELSEEKKILKEKAQEERMETRQRDLLMMLQEQREKDREELERREQERDELEEERRAEEREEQERKDRAYQEELERMKDGIAKNEEQGWVDWAAGGLAAVIAAPFKLVGSLFD